MQQRIDLSGLFCPEVVLRVREQADRCAMGDVLEIISTDPLSVIDVPLYVSRAGHELLSRADEAGAHTFLLKIGRGSAVAPRS